MALILLVAGFAASIFAVGLAFLGAAGFRVVVSLVVVFFVAMFVSPS